MRFANNPEETPIRVLVADSTRIHTQLLSDALRRDRRLEVVGSVSHGRELLGAVTAQKIDVVVVSSNLDEQAGRGLEILREILALQPQVRGVILLDSSQREPVLEAFCAGARGLFSRNESFETLSKCVRRVYEGQIWASSEQVAFAVEALVAAPRVRTAAAGLQSLSRREMDVVHSIVQGLTNREIAERLGLSQHTIKNYLFRVFDKLGISSRLELMSVALAHPPAGKAAVEAATGANGGLTSNSFEERRRAAERGDSTAQAALATMYAQGNGTDPDPVAAYMWYSLAEKTNLEMNEAVSAARRKLADSLTPDQLAEAQKRASEFVPAKQRSLPGVGLGTSAGRR
jgi:DNA-binding NarL/FixJ family response regulator